MRPLFLKHAQRKLHVQRDEQGVPHIEAESWREALYGLGYLHALDRPTQMLFARSLAGGRGAEEISDKPELLETDRFFRRAGLHLGLADEVHQIDDRHFGDLTAYCEGVTDGLKQAGRTLPMLAAGFHSAPWDQMSVLLIGNLLSFGGLAVGQQQNERLILELIQSGVDDDMLRELFAPKLDHADFDLLRQIRIANRLSDETLELITDLPRLAGSNAWAVGPRRSASGHALLASDPHLEINRLPAIWYEAVLRWDGHYVMGATLPGCPLFGIGRTERLAWGVTYMKGDTSDFFIEDCRPGGATGWQYRRDSTWHDFQLRIEELRRKGREHEWERVYFNDVGTLECDPDQIDGGPRPPATANDAGAATDGAPATIALDRAGYYLSTAWIGSRPGASRAINVWLDVIAAPSTQAAMDMVRSCPQPTLCWIFADRPGHIGLQGGGWIPKHRDPHAGLIPLPAWDSANHWQGLLSESYLPTIYDPPSGFISSANENVNVAGRPELVTMAVPDYRKRRIEQRLAELPAATLADMQALQYDVVSLQARDLLAIVLPELPEGEIKRRLAAWDCSYRPESLEATLFARLYRNMLLEIFGQAPHPGGGGIGWRRMLFLCSRCGFSTMVLTAIDRLLHREHSLWWSGRDKGELIRRAAQKLASEVDTPWAETNSFRFANRFIASPRVGRALGFISAKLPMPGCYATPFQGHLLTTAKRETTFAPSYHFVTDLGADEAWTNLPGGPSESRFSAYYQSDVPLWRSGEYKQLNGFSVNGDTTHLSADSPQH